jgi:hypothetical protein
VESRAGGFAGLSEGQRLKATAQGATDRNESVLLDAGRGPGAGAALGASTAGAPARVRPPGGRKKRSKEGRGPSGLLSSGLLQVAGPCDAALTTHDVDQLGMIPHLYSTPSTFSISSETTSA